MNKRIVVGGGALVAAAIIALVSCRTTQPATASNRADVQQAATARPAPPSGQSTEEITPPGALPKAENTPGPQGAPKTGAEALAEKRKLAKPDSTPALEAMKQYDRDEMLLLAQIQKRTSREPPAAVKQIFEARRHGASVVELRGIADVSLSGDLEMLLVVRSWLGELASAEGAAAKDPAVAPIPAGQPLGVGGTVVPVQPVTKKGP